MKLLLLGLALALAGCTIAPKPITAAAPSLDGNAANSGVIGQLPDGGFEVTPGFIIRYGALLEAGWAKPAGILPVPKPGEGVTLLPNGHYEMDAEHVADFAQMRLAMRRATGP